MRKETFIEKLNKNSIIAKSRNPIVTKWSEGQIFKIYLDEEGGYIIIDPSGEHEQVYCKSKKELISNMDKITQKYARTRKYVLFQMMQQIVEY